jgi:glycerol-3-phosphate acyltransferase PlsY
MIATVLLWSIAGFIAGALPFSVWLSQLAVGRDIRGFGDGNPGAANAVRAGGWRIGLPAVILDGLKGAIPVGIAYHAYGVTGWGLVPVVLAPVFGHAFSPFLGFRGGKAIATTFGVWTGLTLPHGPLVLGSFLALFFYTVSPPGWAVMLTMGAWLLFLLFAQSVLIALFPGPAWLAPWRIGAPVLVAWTANVCLLAWKHRSDLRQTLRRRSRSHRGDRAA